MTADEMFKSLGFEKDTSYPDEFTGFKKENIRIIFDLKYKNFSALRYEECEDFDVEHPLSINIAMFMAIKTKIEELGWELVSTPKKYYVNLPKINTDTSSILWLGKNSKGRYWDPYKHNSSLFTEKEIKEIDPRLWLFAEEVE